jgi:hypothetical protein
MQVTRTLVTPLEALAADNNRHTRSIPVTSGNAHCLRFRMNAFRVTKDGRVIARLGELQSARLVTVVLDNGVVSKSAVFSYAAPAA